MRYEDGIFVETGSKVEIKENDLQYIEQVVTRVSAIAIAVRRHPISEVRECIGVVKMKNGCCEGKAVLIMKLKNTNPTLYACECVCGGWGTTALEHIDEAISHYSRMNEGESIYWPD